MRKAIREWLGKNKLSMTPYNAKRAQEQFGFIDPQFRPPGRADAKEYEGGMKDDAGSDSSLAQENPKTNTLPPFKYTSTAQEAQKLTFKIPRKVSDKPEEENLGGIPTMSMSMEPPLSTSRLAIKIPSKAAIERLKEDCPATQDDDDVLDSDTMDSSSERRTFCPEEHIDPIVNMIEHHFCAHPLIPGYSRPTLLVFMNGLFVNYMIIVLRMTFRRHGRTCGRTGIVKGDGSCGQERRVRKYQY
jgi:hypothetical protein